MWISILQLSLFFEEIEAQLVNMQFVTWAASFTLLQLLTASYWSFIKTVIDNNTHLLTSSTDSTQKPGPGAHSPEKVYINKPSAPNFSLGIRHSEFITPLIIDVTD